MSTRHFLDDLGLASLDQLPQLGGADGIPAAFDAALSIAEAQTSPTFNDPSPEPPRPDAAALESHA